MAQRNRTRFFIEAALAPGILGLLLIFGIAAELSRPGEGVQDPGSEYALLARELDAQAPAERKSASDILLDDLAGNRLSLGHHGGKIVMLSFWASWCPACNAELPLLQSLADALAPKGLVWVGANLQEDPGVVKNYIETHKYTFEALLDPKGEAFDRLQASFLPTTYIFGKNGDLIGKIVGHRDWQSERIRAALERALRKAV